MMVIKNRLNDPRGLSSKSTESHRPAVDGDAGRRRLRVCMLTYSFYEMDGRVRRYAETLAQRGDYVDVVSLKRKALSRLDRLQDVNIHRIQEREKNEKTQFAHIGRLIRFLLKSSLFLTKKHSKSSYDLIHVHNIPDFLVFAALLPKISGAKVILDIHDAVPELYAEKFGRTAKSSIFKLMVFAERLSCAFSDHVIIANHIWQKEILKRSVRTDKCTVVLNYPDEKIFYPRPKSRRNGKLILIYPGSLNPRQGVDIAIRAFASIKKHLPTAEFHIYGEGAGRVELERLVSGLGVEGRVIFKDALPIGQIAERMADADIGIEPKRNDLFAGDAMSTKILEFMSVGIPVIASDNRVHKYYFNDGLLQFFRSGDHQNLAEAILQLANDKERQTALVTAGRLFADKFAWKMRKQEYLDLVDSLVENCK